MSSTAPATLEPAVEALTGRWASHHPVLGERFAPAAAGLRQACPATASETGPVVLIVDDDVDVLASLTQVLRQLMPSALVLSAQTAKKALAIVHTNWPDVVIADFRLPGMSGLELLSILGNSPHAPARILMTAFPSTALTLRAVDEAGVGAIFSKPFDGTLMAQRAMEMLQGRLGRRAARDL